MFKLKEIRWFHEHLFLLHHVIVYGSFIIATGFLLGR
jgi:hypothetical protein